MSISWYEQRPRQEKPPNPVLQPPRSTGIFPAAFVAAGVLQALGFVTACLARETGTRANRPI